MADIGVNDLEDFAKAIAANDIFSEMADPLISFRPDTFTAVAGDPSVGVYPKVRSMSPWESLATTFATSLGGGLLKNYGKQQQADQISALTNILPSLIADPTSVAMPEGMDEAAFGSIKNRAIAAEAEADRKTKERQEEKNFDKQKTLMTLVAVAKTPEGRAAAMSLARDFNMLPDGYEIPPIVQGVPDASSSGSLGAEITPDDAPPAPGLFAGSGIPSLKDKYDSYIVHAQTKLGLKGPQAKTYADRLIEGDRKALLGSVDQISEARKKAALLEDLANTAEVGVSGAGETGGALGGVRDVASKLYAVVSPTETQQRTAQSMLDSIAPDIVKAGRSPGAVTDYENRLLIKSGPSSVNTPEANRALISKMRAQARVETEYADFLEAYKAEKGTTQGAQKLWSKYKAAHPIVDPNTGDFNAERPSWFDFFATEALKEKVPPGMKLQVNKRTGETRLVPK